MAGNKIRKRVLPVGWYPDGKEQVLDIFNSWARSSSKISKNKKSLAAIVPHAGWFFSGDIAFRALESLSKDVDTVIIIGGHLPPGAVPRYYDYLALQTPLGDIEVDTPFLDFLTRLGSYILDTSADNTVEIQLPIVKYFYPQSKIVALRVGSGEESFYLGNEIISAAEKLGRRIVVVGSTDLTHYGEDYMFTPMGHGKEAQAWVRDVNDRNIIVKMENMDWKGVLELGNNAKAACSPGAAVAAMSFAMAMGVKSGNCFDYKTSLDVYKGPSGSSFVGYAGIVYSQTE